MSTRRNLKRRNIRPRTSVRLPRNFATSLTTGVSIKGRADPSSVNTAPWNTLVTEAHDQLDSLSIAMIGGRTIWNYFADQFKVPDVDGEGDLLTLFIRIMRVDAYLLDNDPNTTMFLEPCLITNNVSEVSYSVFRDNPGKNTFAHLHFVYPKTLQSRPFLIDANPDPIDEFTYARLWLTDNRDVASKRDVMIRTHILWKFNSEKSLSKRSKFNLAEPQVVIKEYKQTDV